MKKTGRPQIKIDRENFEKLCGLMCTLNEIAGWYKCSADTIERWCIKTYDLTFADCWVRYSADGKVSIRRAQYLLATEDKNATMLKWLGIQYLDQKDVSKIELVDFPEEALVAEVQRRLKLVKSAS